MSWKYHPVTTPTMAVTDANIDIGIGDIDRDNFVLLHLSLGITFFLRLFGQPQTAAQKASYPILLHGDTELLKCKNTGKP